MSTLLESPPVAVDTRIYTPEDLLRRSDGWQFDLVNGHLVERHMGMKSDQIVLLIGAILWAFVKPNHLGKIFGPRGGYQIFAESNSVRFPDASFVAKGRFRGLKSEIRVLGVRDHLFLHHSTVERGYAEHGQHQQEHQRRKQRHSGLPRARHRGDWAHHGHRTRLRTVIIEDSEERIFLSVGVVVTPLKVYGWDAVATLSRTVASNTSALMLTTLFQVPTAFAAT